MRYGRKVGSLDFMLNMASIEDQEVIEEHNKLVESLRQKNAIVEPPSEDSTIETGKNLSFFLEDYRQKTGVTL